MNNKIRQEIVKSLQDYLRDNHSQAHQFLHHYLGMDRHFFLRSDLMDGFAELCASGCEISNTPLAEIIHVSQEAALDANWFCFALRRQIGRWFYIRIHLSSMDAEQISNSEFLRFKEHLTNKDQVAPDEWMLEVDLEPFSS